MDPVASEEILAQGPKSIAFDSTRLLRWDSALIAFLSNLREAARTRGVAFDPGGLPPHAVRLLALIAGSPGPVDPPRRRSLAERAGVWTVRACEESVEGLAVIGNLCLRGAAALRGRAAVRTADLIGCMNAAGADAVSIVIVVNLLVGGILAFIAATELRQFGAAGYVASLVGVGMVREMAALMTAIIVSGRTGGAFASNLAAMEGDQEIDALRAFGIPVFDYLVLPRVLGLTAMMPILYLYGCLAGVVGGLVVAAATLGVAPTAFIDAIREAVSLAQLALGLAKSVAFGLAISVVSCRVGLSAGRSAADVGRAATSAVVAAIVAVLAIDAGFDFCANLLDV